jgi:quinoprotein glucose dehydrogenase
MRVAGGLRLAATLLVAGSTAAFAQTAMPDGDWRTINRDLAATRYSPLNDVNRANVSQLREAWSYPLKTANTAVPLVIDGTMFVPAGARVVALDADTGAEKWAYAVPADPAARGPGGVSTRGVSYWPGDAKAAARIYVMAGSKMLALDAATGTPVEAFGAGGTIDVGNGYGGTVTIAGDVGVIGAATNENEIGVPGNPRAFDLRTGKKLWEFRTVPQKGERFSDTWGDPTGRSGANMWAFSAPVDEKLGLVYIPIGSPSANYWGGTRPGSNLFGNSVVALDVKTGEYKWHFQTVHHDLWDVDMPSGGSLLEIKSGGKTHPALVTINKSSLFFELDRATGTPIIPVEERPVPKGDVPGEYYSPTQPFPVRPGPLGRVSVSENDIVTPEDTSPEHAAACHAMWEKAGGFYNAGPYTPFPYHADGAPPKSGIQVPGGTGGVNWGGTAVDTKTNWVYMNVQDTSLVGWVEKVPEGSKSYSFDATQPAAYDRASVDGKGPFFSFSAPLSGKYDDKGRGQGVSLSCLRPPWGKLTAVDANSGEIKWAVPLGVVDELPAGKQLVGNSGSAGPTVTAGGLVFVGATNDKRFRAFDAATGQQLWEATLKGNANANPMSYRGRSGKQYVAINAGGTIVTYSLSN